jgi:exonuclease III
VRFIEHYMPLVVDSGKTRPGLIVQCKAGNFDWMMMIVHLKSSSRFDSTAEMKQRARELRLAQATQLALWCQHSLEEQEQDYIIAGDFNDHPTNERHPTLQPLLVQTRFRFLTYNMPSCKKPEWKAIDHIIASESAQKRFRHESLIAINFFNQYPDALAQKISDHCPVVCRFDVTAPDND